MHPVTLRLSHNHFFSFVEFFSFSNMRYTLLSVAALLPFGLAAPAETAHDAGSVVARDNPKLNQYRSVEDWLVKFYFCEGGRVLIKLTDIATMTRILSPMLHLFRVNATTSTNKPNPYLSTQGVSGFKKVS